MKSASMSQAFQVTEVHAWQQHYITITPTPVMFYHQTAAHSSVKQRRSKSTIYSHDQQTSEVISETASKPFWYLSLSPLEKYSWTQATTTVMQPGVSPMSVFSWHEKWQVPHRSGQPKSFTDRHTENVNVYVTSKNDKGIDPNSLKRSRCFIPNQGHNCSCSAQKSHCLSVLVFYISPIFSYCLVRASTAFLNTQRKPVCSFTITLD